MIQWKSGRTDPVLAWLILADGEGYGHPLYVPDGCTAPTQPDPYAVAEIWHPDQRDPEGQPWEAPPDPGTQG